MLGYSHYRSGGDLVHGGYRMLITDQVATAPCTDCVQQRSLIFEVIRHQVYAEGVG